MTLYWDLMRYAIGFACIAATLIILERNYQKKRKARERFYNLHPELLNEEEETL